MVLLTRRRLVHLGAFATGNLLLAARVQPSSAAPAHARAIVIARAQAAATTYVYASFDYPGSAWTTFSSINNRGQIVGDYSTEPMAEDVADIGNTPVRSFVLTVAGGRIDTERGEYKISRFEVADFAAIDESNAESKNTSPLDVNDTGQVVGYYYDANGIGHGYVRSADGKRFATIDHPKAVAETSAFGINEKGQISGTYIDADQHVHGFVLSADLRTFTDFDHPNATSGMTWVSKINNAGQVIGHYADDTGVHAYVRSADGKTFTSFDHPKAVATAESPLDDTCGLFILDNEECPQCGSGEVGGFYIDPEKNVHGYARSADGKTFTDIDYPSAVGQTWVFGMNDAGQAVGFYNDADGISHGFIATPQA